MLSYQNLKSLQTLYTLKALGVSFVDDIALNNLTKSSVDTPINNHSALNKELKSCALCDLNKSAQSPTLPFGNQSAQLMIVSDMPSTAENSAQALAGNFGQKLTQMVENVLNIPMHEVYYTHIVKCIPFHGVLPTKTEILSCMPYLHKQIELVKPKLIVTLGELSYNYLTEGARSFDVAVGEVHRYKDIKLIPTHHPKYIIQNPSCKPQVLAHLNKIKSILCE